MFCPKCGNQISDMSKFCMSCGCNIEEYDMSKTTANAGESSQEKPNVSETRDAGFDAASVTNDGMSKLEAEKKRREAAAQMQIDNYKRKESIGKTLKKRQRRAMLPIFLLILIIAIGGVGFYAYKNGYSAKELANTAKVKIVQILHISTPESTIAAYCEAMKQTDSEAMANCLSEGLTESGDQSEEIEEYSKAFLDYIAGLNKEIQYDIKESIIDGDSATVKVEFNYKDATNVIQEVLLEYMQKAFTLAFSFEEVSDEQMETMLLDILKEKTETVTPKDITRTVSIKCKKKDKKWYISDLSPELTNVATANMYSAFESLSDSLSSSDFDNDSLSVGDEYSDYDMHDVHPGEEIEFATIKLKVEKCEEKNEIVNFLDSKIKADDGTKYIVYTLTIENITNAPMDFNTSGVPLIDSKERTYYIDDASFELKDNLAFHEISPNIPETGTIVFKVPADSEGYRFVLAKDKTNNAYAFWAE